MNRLDFIAHIKDAAISACQGTGLFPSLMIAQAAVESGNGESLLSSRYNNYFGIKAIGGWAGNTITLQTREVVMGKSVMIPAKFRAYNSLEEGFKDRVKFLQENPRYTKAGVFTAQTPEDQALAFQRAGYATDPNYASLLTAVLRGTGQLKQYDIA